MPPRGATAPPRPTRPRWGLVAAAVEIPLLGRHLYRPLCNSYSSPSPACRRPLPPHRAPAALHTAGFRARHRARRRARVAVHPPDTGVIAHGLRSGTLRQSSLPLSRSCDRLATVYKKSKISRYLCCPHFRSFNSLPTVSTENTVASKSAHDGRCNPDKYSSTPSTACSPRSLLPGVSLKSAAARP